MAAELSEMVRKQLVENINQGKTLQQSQILRKKECSALVCLKYFQEILKKFAVFWTLAK